MNENTQKKLDSTVLEHAENGRLACAVALKIAAEAGVSPAQVGAAANRLKIKIFGCQLGCFK